MRRNEPTPEEQEVEEMKQAARVIKEICDRRTAGVQTSAALSLSSCAICAASCLIG